MGRLKTILKKMRYHLKPGDSVKMAREMGVRFTAEPGKEKCRILSEPYGVFGSEPYLITLGERVEITYGVRFITHDGAAWCLRNYDERFKELDLLGPIKVGNNVFIGNNTIILPNVTIGDNVIIGAGSIVTKDIPSCSVAAGVPAKVIRSIDEYADRALHKGGALKTKGLSREEKRAHIRELRPEWFE